MRDESKEPNAVGRESSRVAIVGIGGIFPQSPTPDRFWSNVASGADTARVVPAGRWILANDDAFDPHPGTPDRVYSLRGCFVEGFRFDPEGLALDPSLVEQLDPMCHLALHAGRAAWRDASTSNLDRRRVGVVLGNIALPTDSSSALTREILGRTIADEIGAEQAMDQPTHPLNRYVAGLPGGLLAQALGLGGGSFTLDAACASSLYALKLAADELLAGRADAMLTGGVSRPECLYTQMGFSQLRALSPSGRCSPFDARADGLVVGEGSAMFVLKRLDDARRDGDKIYAVLAGIGLSNDVDGRLLAPSSEGQLRAMRAAYDQAGWQPWDIDLIECHATGTPVGDAVEFESLRQLWQDGPWKPGQCVIGSVKSNIGHTLTAAGSAGLLKVILALQKQTLPPTANFGQPAAQLPYASGPFQVLAKSRPWTKATGTRRCAVSAFGFGGINAHVLLEEDSAPSPPIPLPRSTGDEGSKSLPIAIVGMDAHFGPWEGLPAFRNRVLNGEQAEPTSHKSWGIDLPPGFYMDEVALPTDKFRIPPKELEEMLPQQLLMLKAAAGAIADAKFDLDRLLRTGVFIGIELDLNTTNFDLRWSLLNDARRWNGRLGLDDEKLAEWTQKLRDDVGPPLNANRTMGALGGIVASRIAREFRLGGPSFTISSEECSGLRAVQVAMRLLQQKELDQAIVGAVDLAGDVRAVLTSRTEMPRGEGAAALILKRLDDAIAAGDRVYAVLRDVNVASTILPPSTPLPRSTEAEGSSVHLDAAADIGDAGAATGVASLVKAALSLHHQRLDGHYWLRDRATGPRRATVSSFSIDSNHVHVLLEEHAEAPDLRAGASRRFGLFAVAADDPSAVQRLRDHVTHHAEWDIDALARSWWHANEPQKPLGRAWVASTPAELLQQFDLPPKNDPLGPTGTLAFVFPGSGNHFPGMGRGISAEFPDVFRRQDDETAMLRSQVLPDLFWQRDALDGLDNRTLILGQMALGTVVSDVLHHLGLRPGAAIGYSLGESVALFALRAWTERDEMLQRMLASPLFVSDLAGPCDAARRAWRLKADEAVDWFAGIVPYPADEVKQALRGRDRVYLLSANTPRESVVGGQRPAVQEVVRQLGGAFVPLTGVSTVHCPVAREVEEKYRALHLLRTTPPAGIRFYSGASGQVYQPTRASAADSIVAQAVQPMNFPALIEQAYRDGVRVFVEIGPGASCTRMIGQILGARPHFARSACIAGHDELATILQLLAGLIDHRVPIDLSNLYGGPMPMVAVAKPTRLVKVPITHSPLVLTPPLVPVRTTAARMAPPKSMPVAPPPRAMPAAVPFGTTSLVQQMTATHAARGEAHEVYLRFAESLARTMANQVGTQFTLVGQGAVLESVAAPVVLDREQCLEFAIGSIAKVLGPEFAEVDTFPTRVRLPDEPLMLVDRITALSGEPRSMTSGMVVTEHDIHPGAWYLDAERIPTCIAVEAGQADLFLSGYLGIDFHTRGLAVYRLLDAVVTFHRGLPGPGEVIRYEIHIDHFFRQGNTYLFRFRFEGMVNGEPLLTMRDGCAGFFTAAELEAGQGIVKTELDRRPRPGQRPGDWESFVLMTIEAYSDAQIDALRAGDLVACFGPAFTGLNISRPLTIPGGAMKLVDRVVRLEPAGGRFGLGFVRAEADIHPEDWFLTCHFIDDQVMPGTLMYECCLHTLRIFLLRLGWVAEEGTAAFEPVPGVASRLKCRGQVLASTAKATYEVSIKEIGYRPEPYVIVDALMYADRKPIVEITDMALQLTGATREQMRARWQKDDERKPAIYDTDRITAFAIGNPSEAFGERYRIFDRDRFIARLPGPPYQFLDRITEVHAEPWKMTAGGVIEAQYDVPPGEWYFEADRQDHMPFAVLLEVALQPCGWLAAYIGTALTSPVDMSFRNLGGTAQQYSRVTPDMGTLTTKVRITKAASSGGMVLQDFDFEVTNRGRTVYRGHTNFGFFSKEALAQQVGVRDAKWYTPTDAEQARGITRTLPDAAPLPDRRLAMIDRIDLLVPDGGPHGLGLILGSRTMDPADWFFKAHFYLDPVCPGSLGLESFLQLLKVFALERWGGGAECQFDVITEIPHRWLYRGQVIPRNKTVNVQAVVTALDDERRWVRADGYLSVDGLVIYQMNDFTLLMRMGSP